MSSRAVPLKIALRLGTAFVATFLFSARVGAAETIHWYKNLQEASAAAQEADKPIMIEFWADWCAPCKVMDDKVFADARVQSAVAEKVIAVRLDFDTQKEFVRKYDVVVTPHLVFTTSSGTELLLHRGLLFADDLTALIQALPTDFSDLNRLDRILQKDKTNFDALHGMATRLRAASFYRASNNFYDRALKNPEAKKNAFQRQAILFAMGLNFLAVKDGKAAVPMFTRCLKEFPMSENRLNFMLGLSQAYVLAEKKDQARKLLNAVIAESPQSDAASTARQRLETF